MDIGRKKVIVDNTVFDDLYNRIKLNAEELLPTLVTKAKQINDVLKENLFANDEYRQIVVNSAKNLFINDSMSQSGNGEHTDNSSTLNNLNRNKNSPLVRTNAHLDNAIRPVQDYLREFIEIVEHLTAWLELEISSYANGDDFRIVVQNEILDEFASMKAVSVAFLGQIFDYYEQRAAIGKEICKRPNIDDSKHLLVNIDELMYSKAKLMMIEIEGYFLRIYNVLSKNEDILKQSTRQHVDNYF
ncbi:unnamed protein product [Didymodactylos carnosus]|uniref:Proteasome activator PA28 C-terminal domain-containing protein n=1 Tax=Didymodactylos carnosus TaxID=1234261 RepID=A0A813YE27_9BILA|nr:unnamed protein product [Didymodactylos carnosus]CAF0882906.1 unnamed protein product [Didymodactylos carnosus]CAF3567788.1 unnamed protein product [Didymodactylos carnosus]CAF3668729.1 unnamed protein product [Didymodactylos carnosus]